MTHDDRHHRARRLAPAPGDLELLQRFVNLHDHDAAGRTVDPPREMVRAFLIERGLLTPEQRFTQANRETFLELRGALRHLIEANGGAPASARDVEVLDRLGLEAGLHSHFHTEGPPTLRPRAEGVTGAFGAVVAVVFLASNDGAFEHLKLCAAEDCRSVFYDRSKNHSDKVSMEVSVWTRVTSALYVYSNAAKSFRRGGR